jgi:hypothetical protein
MLLLLKLQIRENVLTTNDIHLTLRIHSDTLKTLLFGADLVYGTLSQFFYNLMYVDRNKFDGMKGIKIYLEKST